MGALHRVKGANVNAFDVGITVLSPDKAQLTKLLKEYNVYFGESDPSVSDQTGHQFDYRMMHI